MNDLTPRDPRYPHHIDSMVTACTVPESPRSPQHFGWVAGCRACLTAMVALAVNLPNERISDFDGRSVTLPVNSLAAVRKMLDECDPLRVRAEQALLPLVAA